MILNQFDGWLRSACAVLALALVWPSGTVCAQVVISEFMAVNDGAYTNRQGLTPDWIELYNTTGANISLAGWRLTDDASNPSKWVFPTRTLPAYGYVLVIADGAATSMILGELHANFKLDGGGEYLGLIRPDGSVASEYRPAYPDQTANVSFGLRPDIGVAFPVSSNTTLRLLIPTNDLLGTSWTVRDFDDSAWESVAQPIGCESSPSNYAGLIRTALPDRTMAAYARIPFVVEEPAVVDELFVRLHYDDGVVIHLNGTAVGADNAPMDAVWNSSALEPRDPEGAVTLSEFDLTSRRNLLVAGTNLLAVHVLNVSTLPFAFSDLLLGAECEVRRYAPVPSGEWRYFSLPTPGKRNTLGAEDAQPPVAFAPERGFYDRPFPLTLSCPDSGATIVYTLDGSVPTRANGVTYTAPVTIDRTQVVRAMAWKANYEPSVPAAHTYLFVTNIVQQPAAPSGFPTGNWGNRAPDYAMDPWIVNTLAYNSRMDGALKSLPSLSIAMPVDDLFGSVNGIYTHPSSEGWERACSVEWIDPSGGDEFQINAGALMQGGAFKVAWNLTRKKSLRLAFRQKYGPGTLKFDLFGGEAPTQFDSITLRAGGNDAYNNWGRANVQYLYDEFARCSIQAMGREASYGTFVHLYLNGLYWGLYNPVEHVGAAFAATHFGGEEADWDVRDQAAFKAGNANLWNAMIAQCSAGLSNNAAYQKLQGNHPDGSRNPAYPVLLDVSDYIDYMLLNIWIGNFDWPGNNWRAAGNRSAAGTGYKFLVWDAEWSLISERIGLQTDITGVGSGAAEPYAKLRQNGEFRLRFADHVQRHCFDGGALSATSVVSRYTGMADGIEEAIIGETARWGDQSGTRYTLENWRAMRANLLANYMPFRTAVVLQQLRNAGLYPAVDAPVFNQLGGAFPPGFALTMTASNAIYYTVDGTDPRQSGSGAIQGTPYSGALALDRATLVKARARDAGGVWSALVEALFVPETAATLRVSELMFHPRNPPAGATSWTAQDFEYVELVNPGPAPVGLPGLRFTQGIDFDFSAGRVASLDPGEHVLVVANLAAFTNRYPNWAAMQIAGEFQHRDSFPPKALSDGGEDVRLEDGLGRTLAAFRYNDARGWPEAADGAGHSLVPLAWEDQTEALDYGGNWRASAFIDGSPGAVDPEPVREAALNEVVAHTDLSDTNYPGYDSNDWLELHNAGTSAVSLAGWYLSDDATNLAKWAIPPTNTLAPGAWIVFDEVSGFHSPLTNGFGLSKAGETVFLSHLPGGGRDRVVDAVRFKGQDNGVSLGRYRDGDAYWYALAPTPVAANAGPSAGVCISEFLYHPATTGDEALVEFVEVHNAGSTTALLWNVDGAWRLDGGVAYTFPEGVTLSPEERLVVVGFDPADHAARANFLATHGLHEGEVRLFGPYAGQLDNHGERLALEKPLASDLPSDPLGWVMVDEIIYFDRAPWPAAADGTGHALVRVLPEVSGRDPANWYAAWPPTPGLSTLRIALGAPEQNAVVFVGMAEPLQAVLDPVLVTGASPQVAFYLGDEQVGTDETAPFTATAQFPAEAGRFALRAELADGASTWTSRTVWVTALALSNATVAAADDFGATTEGILKGAAVATVWAHWGSADGGTNLAGWVASAAVGMVSNAPFTARLDGLLPGCNYAVRFSAVAGARRGWSPAATFFTTRSYEEWPYRTTIRFDGYTDAEPLADFPALVRFGTNLAAFAYSQLGGSWASLRFTDEAGGTPLAYEVDVWNTNGESAVWVRVPALTNSAAICAYWGLAGATNPPPTAAPGAVWRDDDEGVWHWQDGWRDATWRGYEAVNAGSVSSPGVVGAGRGFDGVSNAIVLPLPASWYGTNLPALTLSLWVNPAVPPRDYGTVWGSSELYLQMSTSPRVLKWTARAGGAEWQGPAYTAGAWQMVSLVLSNGTAYLQKNDGAPVLLGAYTPFTPTNAPVLGRRAEGDHPFAGAIDEVRLSRAVRSTAWLSAAYRTVAQPTGFATYGPVESALEPDADDDGMLDAWERLHFGDTNLDGTDDWDGDGLRDGDEYIAGTDPTNARSRFVVFLAGSGEGTGVGFRAVPAGGDVPGMRLYSLELATSLTGAVWADIPGYTNLPAIEGDIVYTNAAPPGVQFYRAKTWLVPPAAP